jgi:glycosyltransferase involved in cell wall biosynthesis
MLEEVDFVLSPSSYVSRSYLERGFKPEQILSNVYPVNLSQFQPRTGSPKTRPLTIINTGSLSLRKGTPYLLDAFKIVRRKHPSARLLLTRDIREDALPILSRYSDLPIEWSAPLPHAQLVERLQNSDIFVLPSIEEGLARSALEAMASGLQVVLTPNTGANDFVQPGVNGEVVPIRDSQATANAILTCAERLHSGNPTNIEELRQKLSSETFQTNFLGQLRSRKLIP